MKIILTSIVLLTSLQAGVAHFTSAKEASKSFVSALEKGDEKTLTKLLTPKYKQIVKLKELDRDDAKRFLSTYKQFHRFVSFDGKSVYMEVGKQSWTFPVPLVKDNRGWFFDMNQGLQNMIIREIGRNEMAMIDALKSNPSFEDLAIREDLKAFKIFKDEEQIVALPKDYNKTAITSFVLDKDGQAYEADLNEKDYVFDARFKKLDASTWQ